MLTKEEIRKCVTEELPKLSFYDILELYIDECYQHEITKNTLQITLDKLEKSRKRKSIK